MRDAAGAEPRARRSRDRLVGARQHQRAAAEQGAQEDLQAAIAADVVERAPDHRRVIGLRASDRRGQGRRDVHDHLRHAGGAGGEQHPFGMQLSTLGRAPAITSGMQTTGGGVGAEECRPFAAADNRVDAGLGDHIREMVGRESGGHRIMRRATPSSSISASAVVSWLPVATSTERPARMAAHPETAAATRSASARLLSTAPRDGGPSDYRRARSIPQ